MTNSTEQKLIEAEELAKWLESESENWDSDQFLRWSRTVHSILSELAELREKVSKMEDEWYSPSHMDVVEERTIKPLREKAEALEWLVRFIVSTADWEYGICAQDVLDNTVCPPIVKRLIDQKEQST